MSTAWIKKKKSFEFSRKLVKYICFTVSILVIGIFLFITSVKTLEVIRVNAENTTRQTAETLVHEYALVFQYLFEGATAELKQFTNSPVFVKENNFDEIYKWFKENEYRKPEYFYNMFFSDLNGNAIISNGQQLNVRDRNYFTSIAKEGKVQAVFGPTNIMTSDSPVILISQAIKNADGELKGVLCASIKLLTLRKMTEEMEIKNSGRFFIIGDNGNFVCHASEDYLGKTFTPHDKRYSKLSSEYLLETKDGVFDSISTDGDEITIYLEQIEKLGWVCGVTVAKNKMLFVYKHLKKGTFIVVLTVLAMVAVFAFVSTLILNHTNLWEASYDSLTGLWTRPKFEKEAQIMLDKFKGKNFALVDMDFRGFKFVNQGIGMEAANEILCICAEVLLAKCKETGGICGKGYADHFYAMGQIESVQSFMEMFEALLEEISRSLVQFEIPVHLKSGITFILPKIQFYNENKTISDMIGEASFAKGTIKSDVLQKYAIYSHKMKMSIDKDQRIERYMEKALQQGEFFVMYQPKIALADDKIKGAEALVRWNSSNPKLGFLTPGEFIPVFEKNGFIVQLDFEVYEMVFKFLREQLDLGNPVVPISVNMSRNHTNPDKFVKEFVRRFEKYNLPPNLIEIEILERASEGDVYNLINVTEKLHSYGFFVAMDDFGSGQSSLNMLSEVPIDVIKFDQHFLRKKDAADGNANMINVLIELGKQLNKKTLFEGVETEEQRNMLRDLECDQVQGYFYSKPLSEKDFVEFVKSHV